MPAGNSFIVPFDDPAKRWGRYSISQRDQQHSSAYRAFMVGPSVRNFAPMCIGQYNRCCPKSEYKTTQEMTFRTLLSTGDVAAN